MVKKIYVVSGKGGTGKTTVATNMAFTLRDMGKRVALTDLDIFCPNVSCLLGINDKIKLQADQKLEPIVKDGIQFMSVGFDLPKGLPVRISAVTARVIAEELVDRVNWDNPDYIIIDMPPGTDNIIGAMIESIIGESYALIVTIGSGTALQDAERVINMLKESKIKVVGVLENFEGDFISGLVVQFSIDMGVEFLGAIRRDKKIVKAQLEGNNNILSINDNFINITNKVVDKCQ